MHLAGHVTSRHDTTRSTCRAHRDERVRQARHSQNTWARTSCRVETWRGETSGIWA